MRVKVIRAVRYCVAIQTIVNDILWPALYRGVLNVRTPNCQVSMQMCQSIYRGFYKICKTIRICLLIIRRRIRKTKMDDVFTRINKYLLLGKF